MLRCRKRQQQKRQWNAEWGRVEREGNLWWLEDWRTNWEQVMGKSVWEWFRMYSLTSSSVHITYLFLNRVVPIGRSLNDGMHFPLNPRHDPDGRWRPRSQWPEELR